jgi:hypothetical protein
MVFLYVSFQGGNDQIGHGFDECLGLLFGGCGACIEQRDNSGLIPWRNGWVFYIHGSSFTVKLDWRTL